MTKTPLWQTIGQTLREEIASSQYTEGDKLPTEAALATRFGVNRHTVRHALKDLIEDGTLLSRRGSGVFVAHKPVDYRMSQRPRFHQTMQAAGRLANRKFLRLEILPSTKDQAKALDIPLSTPVLIAEGLTFSTTTPVAHFKTCFPITRLTGLDKTLETITSITEALKHHGVPDYTRRSTRVSAEVAHGSLALHLKLKDGAPLLKVDSIDEALDKTPVSYGQTRFCGERISLIFGAE